MKLNLLLIPLLCFIFVGQNAISGESENSLKNSLRSLKVAPIDYKKNCAECARSENLSHPISKLISTENNQEIYVSELSEEEINNLFKEFANNEDFAFKYTMEGCFARAMIMSKILDDKGIISGKAFIEGTLFQNSSQFGEYKWSYHVAPIVKVKKGSKSTLYVIDPTLFDRPVPYIEWKNKILSNPLSKKESEYFTNRFAYGPFDKNNFKKKYNEDELLDAANENKGNRLKYDMMDFIEINEGIK